MVEVWYDAALAAHSVAYLCLKAGKRLSCNMVLSLAYAADRISMQRYGFPVIDDIYQTTMSGPSGRQLAALLTGAERHEKFTGLFIRNGYVLGTMGASVTLEGLDELSVAVTRVLDEVWLTFGAMDEDDMMHWMVEHCIEWETNSAIGNEIELGSIFRAVGVEDADECVRQVLELRGLATLFANMRVA